MARTRFLPAFVLSILVLGGNPLAAAERFIFPEGKHGKGHLKHINGVPVLFVQGTPNEIGEQSGVLALKPGVRTLGYPEDLLKANNVGATRPLFVSAGKKMFESFPADYQQELEAMVKAAGVKRDRVILGNTLFDLKKLFGCSVLLAEGERSQTGGPLFGRNLDYPSLGYVHEYSLVTVYKPKGKHAFVAVGFPGLIGCLSGMNEKGLAVAVLEVFQANKKAKTYDARGVPYAVCYRRLLEECSTIGEAAKLLRSFKRTTTTNLAVGDKNGVAIFEVTPDRVVVRGPDKGLAACTNHYCTLELKPEVQRNSFKTLDRFKILEGAQAHKKIDVAELQKYLDAVKQEDHTLQTMVFEPAALKLHVALGACPSSKLPLKVLDLAVLFKE